ncbi:MAG: deoxyribodipyrimidine photo-lyase, partial [Alcanivorax sp.]
MNLVWYRNDLRVHAHRALQQALSQGGPVIAVYCLCEQQWDAHEVAPLRRWYVLQSLLELGDALAARGVDLHVLDAGDFAAVPAMLADFASEHDVEHIFCSREYPLNELNRDRAVARALESQGVGITGYDDSVLVPPRTLNTGKGTPYTVFSAYKKRWDVWLDSHFQPVPPLPEKRHGKGHFVGRTTVDAALKTLTVADSLTRHWQPGESAALKQLDHFVEHHLAGYRKLRD